MAHPQGVDFRRPQGDRGLAPAQVGGFSIASFLVGVAAVGSGVSGAIILAVSFGLGAGFLVWKRSFLVAIFVLSACGAGALYYHSYFSLRAAWTNIPFDPAIQFSGIVVGEPGHSAKSEYFTLRLAPPFRGTIKVIASPESGFRYGDVLRLNGQVRSPEIERDLPAAIFPKIERVDSGRGSMIRQALSDLKYGSLKIFPRYLPEGEAAFLGGITLGAKASFSPDFIAALAASGTTHLVALSGYNIAILVFVVFGGCIHLCGRRLAFYITTLAIFFFVVMVGAEPSVVRAAAMAFVALLARELGRPYGLPTALLWTAFLMVLFDPGSIFMPGFQLSFMSLLGIVYLSPVILKWFGADDDESGFVFGSFRENAALTISAQLVVVPIALSNFGGISLTSFIANSLILPFMPITMFFGFALLACGSIFPPLGLLAGSASHVLLAYEIAVIHFFAKFSFPISATLPAFGILLYYLFLAILVRRHELQERKI